MSEDYDEVLDQNVDEVKKSIREMDSADFESILQAEQDGKDRKTIREFLEDRIEEAEQVAEPVEEAAEEIEEETRGGFLGGFDREKILAGGVIAGIVIGLLAGLAFAEQGTGPQQAEDAVERLFEAGQLDAEVVNTEAVSGVYRVEYNITTTNPLTNQTSEITRSIFVSEDGRYVFQGSTVEEQIQAAEQAQSGNQSR